MSDTPTNEPYFDPELYVEPPEEVDEPQPVHEDGTAIPTPDSPPASTKPKFIVIGDKLYCQTADGELVFPLRFKTKLLRQLRTFTDMDETDQLFWLLEEVGQKDVADRMGELDIFETLAIVGRYFREFEARSQAAMGESSGSQNS